MSDPVFSCVVTNGKILATINGFPIDCSRIEIREAGDGKHAEVTATFRVVHAVASATQDPPHHHPRPAHETIRGNRSW